MVSKLFKLKLFINKKSGKVLYAEAGKDFVDFLLSLPTLPVGYFVKHGLEDSMFRSIGKLYESVENLCKIYFQPGKRNDMLLKRIPPFVPFGPKSHRLLQKDAKGDSVKLYTCSDNHRYFTDFSGAPCGQCGVKMKTECIYVASSSTVGDGGFVKDAVNYAVTDDLEVKPFGTEVQQNIYKKYGLKDSAKVESREVEFGEAEELAILKASLTSKTVLTDTFLKKKA